jgi:hypothetical protein
MIDWVGVAEVVSGQAFACRTVGRSEDRVGSIWLQEQLGVHRCQAVILAEGRPIQAQ